MSAPSSATPVEKPVEKPVYSRQHVAEHSSKGDFWVIINDGVYDLTDYLSEHPGGEKILYKVAGKDGTKEFKKYHRDAILRRFQDRLQIGVVSSEPPPRKGFLKKLFG